MYEPSGSHYREHQEQATAEAADAFTKAAGKPLVDVKGKLSDAKAAFEAAQGGISFEDLHDIQKELEALTRKVQEQKVPVLLERMKARVGALSDPEAPRFGMEFLAAMEAANCSVRVDSSLDNSAMYLSYSYGKTTRGFVNEVALNPSRVNSEDRFISSTAHEYFHGFEKRTSPALQRSPFNPESRAIIHPADWVLLEGLCERDAYTKQAFINSMLAKGNPELRAASKTDVVSVDDFERIRANSASLADALVTTALQSLSKPLKAFEPNGRTFVNHYQDVALKNYSAGMAMRKKEGETDLVFLRVELDDLWQIGNYGVGPNSFGKNIKEPLIATRHALSADAQANLDRICKEHGIPPLEKCPTVRQYNESLAFMAAQTQTVQTPASAPFLAP